MPRQIALSHPFGSANPASHSRCFGRTSRRSFPVKPMNTNEGVNMNSQKLKTALHSAGAVTVVSVLVSVVGAGTKWMS